MFTGIVETKGRVVGRPEGAARLRVDVGAWASECELGASVAINGACLTVARVDGRGLEFDVVRETLDRTTLGSLRVGSAVNVERALRAGARIDGHFVQGHVDGTAEVIRVEASSKSWETWFRPQDFLLPYIIPKGSIALDGVSLTLARVERDRFSVALIPTTLSRTTLADLKPGDRVNVETDILVRTLVHTLDRLGWRRQQNPERQRRDSANESRPASGPLTPDMLKEAGWA